MIVSTVLKNYNVTPYNRRLYQLLIVDVRELYFFRVVTVRKSNKRQLSPDILHEVASKMSSMKTFRTGWFSQFMFHEVKVFDSLSKLKLTWADAFIPGLTPDRTTVWPSLSISVSIITAKAFSANAFSRILRIRDSLLYSFLSERKTVFIVLSAWTKKAIGFIVPFEPWCPVQPAAFSIASFNASENGREALV